MQRALTSRHDGIHEMRGWLAVGILAGLLGTSSGAAQQQPGSPSGLRRATAAVAVAARPITHGEQISADLVGPAAAGYKKLAGPFAGSEIRDGRSYPFVREIAAAARYDGFEVPVPHLLVEGARFDGPLDIYATKPIVFRGVSIRTMKAAYWAVHTRPGAGAIYFLWSDAGAARTDGAPNDRTFALDRALYLRADNATVHRSHLSRTADGIQLHGTHALVSESLIDDLTYWEKDHNDGIQMLGRGADATIVRNRIVNRNRQTSCLNLIGDRVRVEDNYLAGGGWVIYGGANANGHGGGSTRQVVIRGNVFSREVFPKSGYFGAIAYWDKSDGSGNIWDGNRYSDGSPVTP